MNITEPWRAQEFLDADPNGGGLALQEKRALWKSGEVVGEPRSVGRTQATPRAAEKRVGAGGPFPAWLYDVARRTLGRDLVLSTVSLCWGSIPGTPFGCRSAAAHSLCLNRRRAEKAGVAGPGGRRVGRQGAGGAL